MRAGMQRAGGRSKQRCRCTRPDGSFHRFLGVVSKTQATDDTCTQCENRIAPHEGPAVPGEFEYLIREIANALIEVGRGGTYIDAAKRVRMRANIGKTSGMKGVSKGQTVADSMTGFAPIVAARAKRQNGRWGSSSTRSTSAGMTRTARSTCCTASSRGTDTTSCFTIASTTCGRTRSPRSTARRSSHATRSGDCSQTHCSPGRDEMRSRLRCSSSQALRARRSGTSARPRVCASRLAVALTVRRSKRAVRWKRHWPGYATSWSHGCTHTRTVPERTECWSWSACRCFAPTTASPLPLPSARVWSATPVICSAATAARSPQARGRPPRKHTQPGVERDAEDNVGDEA